MSYPTLVGSPTNATGAAASINFPAGIAPGDRIYCMVYGAASSITAPAFTTAQSGAGNFGIPYALYTRTATGTEGASAAITGSASAVYLMWVERGVNVTAQEEAWAVTAASNTATYAIPSSASTVDTSWQIMVCVDNQRTTNMVATPPSGATLIGSLVGSGGSTLALYYRPVAAAGDSGTTSLVWGTGGAYGDTFTFVSRGAVVVAVAPKPTGWKKFQLSTIFSAVAALIAPFVQSNAVIIGSPTVGFPVAFVTATMGGYLAPTRTGIQWTLDGVNIAGATGTSYTPVSGDATHALRVAETWTNASGTVTSTSAAVIVNAAGTFMYSDAAFPTFTTKHGYGNLSNGRVDLRPIQKRILVDGTTSTNGNYYHVASIAAAKAVFAPGDWILMPGGQSGTTMFGELWTGTIALAGTSNQNPFVLGTFDPADKENDTKFNTLRYTFDASGQGESVCIYADHGVVSNIAIVNMIFKSNGTASDAAAVGVGIVNAQSHYKLFENCLFDGTICALQSNNTVTTPFVNTLDSTLANDSTLRYCGLMYANGKNGARSGNLYSDSCRRLRIEACVDFHGGWSRGMTRATPAWASGSAILSLTSLTSVGTTATATTDAPHGLITGHSVNIAGASNVNYNKFTPVTVTGASTFTYPIVSTGGVAAAGTLTWQNYSSNGWTIAAGDGPDGYKHGMYITENNDDVQIHNCVTGLDAANLKFTGGTYRIQNLVIIDSPMAFIYASIGNSGASWPSGSTFRCDNLLQVGSDDQQTAPLDYAYRGWLPHIYDCSAGSYLRNALMLNATDPNGTNRQAVLCSANGSLSIPTSLTMDQCVTANWAIQDTTINPDAATTVTFTNNIWQAPSSAGGNLIIADTPAAYQTKLTNALTRSVGDSLRLAQPAYFSTVVAGANVRASNLNMLEFMAKNTIPDGVGGIPNPWCSLIQTHFRSALV